METLVSTLIGNQKITENKKDENNIAKLVEQYVFNPRVFELEKEFDFFPTLKGRIHQHEINFSNSGSNIGFYCDHNFDVLIHSGRLSNGNSFHNLYYFKK